jgi:hypothetical protein
MRLMSEIHSFKSNITVRPTGWKVGLRLSIVVVASAFLWGSKPLAQSPTPIPIDGFITMNGSPIGTRVTPAVMNAGTEGFVGGNWTVNDSNVAISVGPNRFNLPMPIKVGNTVYPVGFATQSMQYDTFYSFNDMQGNFPDNNFSKVTISGFITFGIPNLLNQGASLSDLVRVDLNAGAFSCFQLFNGTAPGDKYAVNIETDVSGTTHSPFITVTPGASYWYSFKTDYGAGKATLNMYSLPNFTLVGSVIGGLKKGSNLSFVRIGNGEEAQSKDHTHFNYFEDTLIDWTNATFPLVPTTTPGPSAPQGLRISGS